MKVWVDISAPAHVLVFRPLIALLRERGDEIEVTTRDYAQTLELLDRHGIEAEVLGAHGGRSRVAKAFALSTRLRALRRYAKGRGYDLALAHGSHELTITARRLGIPSATTHDYEYATLQTTSATGPRRRSSSPRRSRPSAWRGSACGHRSSCSTRG